jgi:hypothetical protein
MTKIEVELIAPAGEFFTPENIPIEIVYEDETLVVVNKPARDSWSIPRPVRLQARLQRARLSLSTASGELVCGRDCSSSRSRYFGLARRR